LAKKLFADQAVLVVEHEETVQLPDEFSPQLVRVKFRTYQGQTAVSIFTFQSDQGSENVE
jgi:hypothetical protein